VDDSYRLSTPEQIDLTYDVAGLGSRCVAALLDGCVQAIVITALYVALTVGAGVVLGASSPELLRSTNRGTSDLIGYIVLAILVLVFFLITTGYYIFFEMAWNGQSPGKRLAGIRVLTVRGQPITLGQSLIRNLLRLIDGPLTSYALGALVMLLNRRSQRLGDLAAGTLVVKVQRETSPRILHTLSSQPELLPLQASALTPDDVALAREFLLRRDELAAERRAALAERIAGRLRGRLGPETTNEPPEELIARVAAARR
jgi:uncharacterized RDD family membrane protein YckC